MKKTALLLLLGSLIWACSDTQKLDENLTVRPTAPVGSVGGVVYDGTTDVPVNPDVSPVNVTVIAGDQQFTGTADADGRFSVGNVPASGNVVVILQADGYLSAELTGTFMNEAGDFPVDNAILSFGPIGLVPSTGSLAVRLITENGAPVSGVYLTVRTSVRYLLYTNVGVEARSQVTVGATTDGAGRATFEGLPDYLLLGAGISDVMPLNIPPVDVDGDGNFEYPGGTRFVYYFDTQGPERLVVLDTSGDPDYPNSLSVVASNVTYLEGFSNHPPGANSPAGPVYVLFNLPVDPDTLVVRLVEVARESGNWVENTAETNLTVDGRFLTIEFPTPLAEGTKYDISVHAMSIVGDAVREGNFYGALFTGYSGAPPAVEVVAVERDPEMGGGNTADILVHFNQPVGTGNPAWNNLHSANCVLWFNTPLDDIVNPGPGNSPGEWGFTSCNLGAVYALKAEEELPDMIGAQASGFAAVWRFTPPQAAGPNPMPAGVAFYMKFSEITNASYLMTTPDGRIVTDQMDQTTP